MTRIEVYDAILNWLNAHNFTAGYVVQKRFWNEADGDGNSRYMIIQQTGGGSSDEGVLRDYFRIILLSGGNDTNIDAVELLADNIRQAMLDDYKTDCIINMTPIGGLPVVKTEEGRWLFEINFQSIISR